MNFIVLLSLQSDGELPRLPTAWFFFFGAILSFRFLLLARQVFFRIGFSPSSAQFFLSIFSLVLLRDYIAPEVKILS